MSTRFDFPGDLFYTEMDGESIHRPGSSPWTGSQVKGSLDLANLRMQLIYALGQVEDELARRGLLDRVTNRD